MSDMCPPWEVLRALEDNVPEFEQNCPRLMRRLHRHKGGGPFLLGIKSGSFIPHLILAYAEVPKVDRRPRHKPKGGWLQVRPRSPDAVGLDSAGPSGQPMPAIVGTRSELPATELPAPELPDQRLPAILSATAGMLLLMYPFASLPC